MGSQSKIHKTDLAYIAGFLDGDGSVMLQIKKRSNTKTEWRLMCTICFYQDTRHAEPLYWIQQKLAIGYISKRNDGITELRINGYNQCARVLNKLKPFIRFKKIQVDALCDALTILLGKRIINLSLAEKKKLLDCIVKIQNNNYQSPHKRTKLQLKRILLGLTP